MAGFRLDLFSGVRPRASDVRLAVHEAVSAVDVDLRRGLLRPRPKQKIWVPGVDPQLPILTDNSDVVLLMHFDGADGSTSFLDSSQYENAGATGFSDAQLDTSQFKFGNASLDLTTTGDQVTVPITLGGPLDIFQGDFTIEMWVRFSTVTGQHTVFDYGDFVGSDGIRVYVNNGALTCQTSFYHGWTDITHGTTVTTDTWHHIAVSRAGTTGYLALNGVVLASVGANWITFPSSATKIFLGTSSNQTAFMLGRIDEIRVTRGLARYTTNFAVSTAAFSATGTPKTLYRFNRRSDDTDFWLYFSQDVNVVPGPAESAEQRHYYTGDHEPRMFTADSIDDTTPPYAEPADTKYPYTWFKLGVPAPATAPVLDVDSLPEPSEGSVGLITSVTTETLIININNALSNNDGLQLSACGEDGRNAGVSTANIQPQGGSQVLTCLKPGTRVRVTEVIDGDNVRVVAAGRSGPIEDMGMIPDSTNWSWDNAVPEVHKHKWLTRLNSTAKRKSFFVLPTDVALEVENHSLRVDDIIRITGAAAPMSITIAQDIVTTPVPTDKWPNSGFRTGTLDTADDFVFEGAASFMIERDGSSIDPVVPATADFEIETRAYVYTFVSALGEESAPSPPSEIITIRAGDEVPITTFAAPPTERRNIDRIWIYRTSTGSEDTAFQFVGELAVDDIGDGFTDDVPPDELGEVLETEGWDVPDENMIGIVALPNGFLAGFFDNVLCFSEPGFPHAWPPDYRQALDFDIVGLEVFGNALVVTTKGKPYIAVGVHPLQISARHVDVIQSCIDKRSIVKAADSVLYASPEGLISAGAGFSNVTEKYYTKEQWLAMVTNPETSAFRNVRAWYYDSQYIMHISDPGVPADTPVHKLIFDFRDGELRDTTFTEPLLAAFADPETAELYYLVAAADEPSGTVPADARMLLRWDYNHPDANVGTQFAEGDYTTGQFRLPQPMAFSCARVQCRRVPTVSGTMNAHAQVLVTVNGRRYDAWNAATTPDEDDIVLINAQAVIDGQPTVGGWAGEQRSAPFRVNVNTLVDAVSFDIHVEGPIEVETIQLGECMEDLEQS